MGLRERILKANRAAKLGGMLTKQQDKLMRVQALANKEAEQHPGEKWECSHCHELVPIRDYPKHYFKCDMADKLPKVMPK